MIVEAVKIMKITMEKKQLTWKKLKEFCDSLNEHQLSCPLRLWGTEEVIFSRVEDLDTLEERYFNDGEMYSPESTFDDFEEQVEDKTDFIEKGTPIIYIN